NDEWDINDRWLVNAGLRGTYFQQVGPFDRYEIDPISGNPKDTIHYKAGQNVQRYSHVEPRVAIRYSINHLSSLKASVSQNFQYIHLA
ncbi:TonB-dependent receptor, partial [Klebsiella pneumoniae]|nr:TonB-dependent receptor [Klebsiella pneumoniae]